MNSEEVGCRKRNHFAKCRFCDIITPKGGIANENTKRKNHRSRLFVFLIIYIVIDLFPLFRNLRANINFALDSSKPTPYVCEISDKKMSAGAGKYRKAYWRIQVEIDGEAKWLDISASEYDFYRVGDTITINLFEGFLGEPYLISNNID